jgi:ABC-type multidrug transport system fused ATPase/permease subunit
MTAVERVLEYCALDQEPPAQLPPHLPRPPPDWPAHGRIVFDNVCMSHSSQSHAPLALNHISLTIEPASKVGVVGRTGAGKSSLIQTLFRMGTLVDGCILIDDIDIESVGLDDLRRRISIIPQDPVLFTGTMRSNLDQFGDYSDAEIWRAIEQVSELVAW